MNELDQLRCFIKKILLFISPVLFLAILFFVLDPFYMLHHGLKWAKSPSSLNADFKVIQRFHKYNDSLNFNAFIFGNSKALGFISPHWKKHIGIQKRVFNFSSPGESLLNIRRKLEIADKSGNRIEDALLILDHNIIINTDNNHPFFEGPVYLKGPQTSNNSLLEYYGKGFYYFLYKGWFISYFRQLKNSTTETEKEDTVFIKRKMSLNEFKYFEFSNESFRWDVERNYSMSGMDTISQTYFNTSSIPDIVVSNVDLGHLEAIKKIFKKHRTSYKIVFGPYKVMPETGQCSLKPFLNLFGKDKVFDFRYSPEVLDQNDLFYDESHYRPLVGERILNQIY